VRRLFNQLAPRRPLNPPPLPPPDFSLSDFADFPEEAWELADLEIERAEADTADNG
jgi:hypothetical protein